MTIAVDMDLKPESKQRNRVMADLKPETKQIGSGLKVLFDRLVKPEI